jgi:hypothetical protein
MRIMVGGLFCTAALSSLIHPMPGQNFLLLAFPRRPTRTRLSSLSHILARLMTTPPKLASILFLNKNLDSEEFCL